MLVNPSVRKNLSLHGITWEEKAWLLYTFQDGFCAICKDPLDISKAVIDHFHGCPAHKPQYGCKSCIRGALCVICNSPILMKLEEKEHLQNEYVRAYLARRPFLYENNT